MNFFKLKLHYFFWIFTLLILIIQFLVYKDDSMIDINVHDTYYVIKSSHFAGLLAVIYFLFGLGYFIAIDVLKRKLIKILTWLHSFIFVGGFIVYWLLASYDKVQREELGILHDSGFMNVVMLLLFLLMLISTPIYIVNLLIGIFRKK